MKQAVSIIRYRKDTFSFSPHDINELSFLLTGVDDIVFLNTASIDFINLFVASSFTEQT